MIKREEVYKIGIFNKPHGIHGELSFTFTDDIFDRVEAEYLICLLDGILVPFFLEEYRFRSDTTALVKLEGVDTAERARMFTNIEAYFPVKHAEEAGPGELSWDFFVGFRMEEGIFNKPHGIHGELSFTFTDDIFDRVEAEYLICLLDGILVPFFLEEYRFRSDTTALVKLEGVDTAERARMFTNIEAYFPVKHAEEAGPGELSWDFFVGFRMEEVHHGTLGEVTDVDTSTINTLFVVDYQGEELLVPAQEEFIIDIDQKHKVITVDLPEGLIALDETEEV